MMTTIRNACAAMPKAAPAAPGNRQADGNVCVYTKSGWEERDEPDTRAAGDAKGLLAHLALHGTALSDLLHRPGECRLRRADDAPGFGPQPGCFRPRCGDRILPRLFPARSAEQRHAPQGRRATVDRAHHDQLGTDFG